jgi:hypothetical protein
MKDEEKKDVFDVIADAGITWADMIFGDTDEIVARIWAEEESQEDDQDE